jgi:hypothetical protein
VFEDLHAIVYDLLQRVETLEHGRIPYVDPTAR